MPDSAIRFGGQFKRLFAVSVPPLPHLGIPPPRESKKVLFFLFYKIRLFLCRRPQRACAKKMFQNLLTADTVSVIVTV